MATNMIDSSATPTHTDFPTRPAMNNIIKYNISDVREYINWAYFYHAWQLRDKDAQEKIRHEAIDALDRMEGKYHTHAIVSIGRANADGDDIIFEGTRLPMLRQQKPTQPGEPNLCLADFIRPVEGGVEDRMGLFCTTVDMGIEKDFDSDDYEKMLMQLIADRLAEATAEKLHEDVRKRMWGYVPHENLTMQEIHAERFQGIRPAVGYPSLPDTSLNFVIDSILHFADVGIRLTGSGAMKPHASVSGLMMAHPKARYFAVGRVGDDQLRDYARRRGIPADLMRRFIGES